MFFTAAAVLLVLAFTLVALPITLFIIETDLSSLGKAWQAVAQVYSFDTEAAVQHGTMATDGEVRESVMNCGFHEPGVSSEGRNVMAGWKLCQ